MTRFFVSPDQIFDDYIVVRGTDVHHIKNVLRMKVGDEISISDGAETDYFCTINDISTDEVLLKITNSWRSYSELPVKIYLFQALPKADKMEFIIQKAVELGAYEIIPVVTERSIVKLDQKRAEKKLARWNQIAESAAKQSGRSVLPKVTPLSTYSDAIKYANNLDKNLIPYEKSNDIGFSKETIANLPKTGSLGVFIGPEGGFTDCEINTAMEAKIIPISLGKRILRTETAGLAALSILMFHYE